LGRPYERGANRISASTLFETTRALVVSDDLREMNGAVNVPPTLDTGKLLQCVRKANCQVLC